MKNITVNDLIAQLTALRNEGYGNAVVWYRTQDSMDERLEQGVWDYDSNKENVALG